MRARSIWVAGAALAALVATGAGAATAGSAGATVRPHAAPAVTPTGLTTAGFTFRVSVTGLAKGTVTLSGRGQLDLADHTFGLELTLPPAVVARFPTGGTSPVVVRAVFSAGTVYLDIPGLTTLAGRTWVSVALPAKVTSGASRIDSAVATAIGDVPAAVTFAEHHGATVTALGSKQVHGVAATGNRITVSGTRGTVGGAVSADLWQDASHRLIRATVDGSGTGAINGKGLNATVDVGRFGAPVTFAVPPADQTVAVPFSTVASLIKGALHTH